MEQNRKTPVNIDGASYVLEDMSERAQALIRHVANLDQKIGAARFSLDQLEVGRQAFMSMLKSELADKPEPVVINSDTETA